MIHPVPEIRHDVASELMAQAVSLLERRFSALLSGDMRAFAELYAEDAVWEWPFVIPGGQPKAEGREAISRYLASVPGNVRFSSFDDVLLRQLADSSSFIVSYRLSGEFVKARAPYVNRIVSVFTIRDRLFAHYLEHFDSFALYQATSALGGDAPFRALR